MSLYDDARNPLHANPLELRARSNGAPYGPGVGIPKYDPAQNDANHLATMRLDNAWNVANVPYLANQVVYHEGHLWAAQQTTSAEPTIGSPADWLPLTGIAGRGRMSLSAPLLGGTIGAAWSPVTAYDQIDIATLVGCTLDLAAGTVALNYPGVWRFNFSYFITHNESNQSRQYQARIFNVTDGTGSQPVPVGIGRNTDATALSWDFLADIAPGDVGDLYRFEVGNGDTVSITTLDYLALDVHQVGA